MKTKILNILTILLGLMMLNSGLNKFFGYMPLPEMPAAADKVMTDFLAVGWFMPLVGLAEIIGGILQAIPKTRALGALILFPVLVGIVLLHFFQDPATVFAALIFFAINIWAIYDNKEKYKPMIGM